MKCRLRDSTAPIGCAGQSPLLSLELWSPCGYGTTGLNLKDWDLTSHSQGTRPPALTEKPFLYRQTGQGFSGGPAEKRGRPVAPGSPRRRPVEAAGVTDQPGAACDLHTRGAPRKEFTALEFQPHGNLSTVAGHLPVRNVRSIQTGGRERARRRH